jgi:hypothetical protein
LGGTPLFSETNIRDDGGGTWSNLIAEDQPITVETIFNAIASLFSLLQNSIGLNIAYSGTIKLYVPMINSEKWQQAVEAVNSIMNPGTSDNRINAAIKQFKIQLVSLRYLTNEDAWFIGWEPSAPNYGLTLINRVEPDISPLKPFGGNDDVWYSRLRMRFDAKYSNKRGIAAVNA